MTTMKAAMELYQQSVQVLVVCISAVVDDFVKISPKDVRTTANMFQQR